MKYFIVAGERSGDLHGSNLIEQILHQDPEAEITGWGGELMESSGAKITTLYHEVNFMGFWEVLKNITTILRKLHQCKQEIRSCQPDVLVLIDFAGFNLRLARFAKRIGIKVCYYISPKIWAWNKSRIRLIRKSVDRMLVVFPFEEKFYQDLGFDVDYIGNPIMDAITKNPQKHSYNDGVREKTIAFLPGSRKQEVMRSLEVIRRLVIVFEEYKFIVSTVSNLDTSIYDPLRDLPNVEIIDGHVYDVLRSSHAAIVTSGTATLEAALLNVPQVVVYRTSLITYLIAKALVGLNYISLVNLLLEKEVVTELVQGDYNAANIASELETILSDSTKQKKISEGYSEIRVLLGEQSASKNAATAIIKLGRS
ncbi:MAG: lipid-A-disaccharide synthase [Marinoscillum sp.]